MIYVKITKKDEFTTWAIDDYNLTFYFDEGYERVIARKAEGKALEKMIDFVKFFESDECSYKVEAFEEHDVPEVVRQLFSMAKDMSNREFYSFM